MKSLPLIIIVLFFPLSSLAEDVDKQIDQACLRHAVSLVNQLKADVFTDMDKTQSNQVLKTATETCQAHFNKEFDNTLVNKEETAEEDSDWFTDKLLSGEVERKDGNKRLMRRR